MSPDPPPIEIRNVRRSDAEQIWGLARGSDALDTNSFYAYLLLCTRFRDTCFAAVSGEDVKGFVTGFVPPEAPGHLFVWQLYVSPELRGRGWARTLLSRLVRSLSHAPEYVEATIAPSNAASLRTFTALARELGAHIRSAPYLADHDFPVDGGEHEAENLITVGPIRWNGN